MFQNSILEDRPSQGSPMRSELNEFKATNAMEDFAHAQISAQESVPKREAKSRICPRMRRLAENPS